MTVRKYIIKGHYRFDRDDFRSLDDFVIEAYTAEDALTQVRITYPDSVVYSIGPFKPEGDK